MGRIFRKMMHFDDPNEKLASCLSDFPHVPNNQPSYEDIWKAVNDLVLCYFRNYDKGNATAFVTRSKALRKLQLTLPDFRRLCILKGIYPIEPKHRKKVNKGSTVVKTHYYVKDIQFLLHEPIINKFREFKHFIRRLARAKGKRDFESQAKIRKNRPKYKIDHIVKERYPTFIDAVRDLEDCLCMVFLFATLPSSRVTSVPFIDHCRRLSVEFLHYVIASKSLRKVFISIKGIYYQAEILGQMVTWIVPHSMGHQTPSDVDFKVMQTFIEFYSTLLGFVNFRLYTTMNLFYPPKLSLESSTENTNEKSKTEDDTPNKAKKGKKTQPEVHRLNQRDIRMQNREEIQERLSALTQSLMSIDAGGGEDEVKMDEFPTSSDDPDVIDQAKVEMEKMKKFQNLFKGLKFFLNREVPRETLVFVIRSFGGEVSWHETVAVGSTFPETDEKITHQIVDRPSMEQKFLSRYYVQPQWVFDSINAQMLVPPEDYFIGVMLPPHLSPFITEQEGDYVPPERQALLNKQQGLETDGSDDEESASDEDNEEDEEEEEEEDEAIEIEGESDDDEVSEDEEEEEEEKTDTKDVVEISEEEEEEKVVSDKGDAKNSEKKRKRKKRKSVAMAVEAGDVEEDNVNKKLKTQKDEERRLAELMIPKKKRRLYQKIMFSRKKKKQEARVLEEKRAKIDMETKKMKKQKKSGRQA